MNNLLKKYNALDGKKVSRKQLKKIHQQLFDNLPLEIPQIEEAWRKIGNLLKKYPKAKDFELTVKAIELPKNQLNAPRHKGLAKQGLSECGRLKKGYKYVKGGKIVKVTPTPKKKAVKKYDFIYEVTYNGKYYIKTFKKLPKNRGLKQESNDNTTVKGIKYYSATENAFKNLKKQFPDYAYANKGDIDSKNLKKRATTNPTPKKKAVKKPQPKKQLALFGGKKKRTPAKRKPRAKTKVGAVRKSAPLNKGLGALVPQIKGLQSVANRTNTIGQTYKITGDIATLLGSIEIKPKGSVAVTLDAPQGAGKTRAFFQIINEFAKNYKVLFVSAEEHPQSALFNNKLEQYVSAENQKNVYAIDETNFSVIKQYIPQFDVIFIDSWNKIAEKNNVDFDFDLRKGFDSKLFFAIFQRTQDGKMRGGSKAQFDGDIILKIPKQDDFKDNFIVADKNRYQDKPIEELKYNIYHQRLIQEPGSNNEPTPTTSQTIILEV